MESAISFLQLRTNWKRPTLPALAGVLLSSAPLKAFVLYIPSLTELSSPLPHFWELRVQRRWLTSRMVAILSEETGIKGSPARQYRRVFGCQQ